MSLDFSAGKARPLPWQTQCCAAVRWMACYFCLALVLHRIAQMEKHMARPCWDLGVSPLMCGVPWCACVCFTWKSRLGTSFHKYLIRGWGSDGSAAEPRGLFRREGMASCLFCLSFSHSKGADSSDQLPCWLLLWVVTYVARNLLMIIKDQSWSIIYCFSHG